MSDNQRAPLWYPPSFPVEGRLPTTDWREMGVGLNGHFRYLPLYASGSMLGGR
jgi:hypothetical protein